MDAYYADRREGYMRCITICILTCVGFQACTPAKAAFHKSQQALSNGEKLCVLQGAQLREIRVEYDLQTGDTLVEGRLLSEVHQSGTPPVCGRCRVVHPARPSSFSIPSIYTVRSTARD